MNVQEQILRAFELTQKNSLSQKNSHPIYSHLAQLMVEVGSLAEAVRVTQGHSNKVASEHIVGDVANIVLSAISVLVKATPVLTDEARLNLLCNWLRSKNEKRAAVLGVSTAVSAPTPVELVPAHPWPFDSKKAEAVTKTAQAVQVTLAQALNLQPIKQVTDEPYNGVMQSMTEEDRVAKRVIKVIAEQLGMAERDVLPHHAFIADLGADSLDVVELVMAIEDEFALEIPDEDAEKCRTVGDAIEYVRKTLPHHVPAPKSQPETGRLYVNIRKHPAGIPQPTGKRRVTRVTMQGDMVKIGIGDGKQGWTINPAMPAPVFLDFIVNSDCGRKVSLTEALEYWKRHNP